LATKTITYPPVVVISGNETLLNVDVSNAYNALGVSVKGSIWLQSFHEVDNYLVFTFNGITITFTCVSNYTGVIGTYPVREGAESLQEWGIKVQLALMSHYQLSGNFMISGSWIMTYYRLQFEPYVKEAVNNLLIYASTAGPCQTTQSSFTPDDIYSNYKLRIQLMLDGNTLTNYRSPISIPFLFTGHDASLQYDLKRLLYTDATGHFTFPETALRHAHSIMQKYHLHLSFLADNKTAESALTNYVYVLPGKMSQTKEKALNTQLTSIYADLVSSKRFLSFAPVTKQTDIYAPEKLYFLFLAAYPNAVMKITERFRSDPAETRDLATFNAAAFSLHEFSVGFQTIKQADYGAKVPTEYEIWIENGSGSLVSERRTFQIDYTYQRMARYFLFMNSYGVYELFRSTGDAEKSNKLQKEFYDRVIHAKVDRTQSRKPVDIQHTSAMMVNSGYMPDPWNNYWAYEFMGSPDVYWLKNNRVYAVQIEEADVPTSRTDLDNLHNFDFKVSLDDMDDTFYQEFLPGSELPIQGDFSNDFSDDFNV